MVPTPKLFRMASPWPLPIRQSISNIGTLCNRHQTRSVVSVIIWLPSNNHQANHKTISNFITMSYKITSTPSSHFSDFLSNNRQTKLKNLCPQSIEGLKNDASLLNPLLNSQNILKFSKEQVFVKQSFIYFSFINHPFINPFSLIFINEMFFPNSLSHTHRNTQSSPSPTKHQMQS